MGSKKKGGGGDGRKRILLLFHPSFEVDKDTAGFAVVEPEVVAPGDAVVEDFEVVGEGDDVVGADVGADVGGVVPAVVVPFPEDVSLQSEEQPAPPSHSSFYNLIRIMHFKR